MFYKLDYQNNSISAHSRLVVLFIKTDKTWRGAPMVKIKDFTLASQTLGVGTCASCPYTPHTLIIDGFPLRPLLFNLR